MKKLAKAFDWVKYWMGMRPAWVNLPQVDPWSTAGHGQHKIEAVSRHAIAETGLICPLCLAQVCEQGDYTQVRMGKVGGYNNEVIICKGRREAEGMEVPCDTVLTASPDTEHGDNLLWDKVPKEEREALFFRFRRVSEQQVVKDKYGFDVTTVNGQLSTTGVQVKPAAEARERITYEVGDVYSLSNGTLGHVTEVLSAHEGDSIFAGWGIMEIDGDGVRWFADPTGKIRRDMTDPTMSNITLVTKQQKV